MQYNGHIELVDFTVTLQRPQELSQAVTYSALEQTDRIGLFFDCTPSYPDEIVAKGKIRVFAAINKLLKNGELTEGLYNRTLFITIPDFINAPPERFNTIKHVSRIDVFACMQLPLFITDTPDQKKLLPYMNFLDMYRIRLLQCIPGIDVKSCVKSYIGFNPTIHIRGISDWQAI